MKIFLSRYLTFFAQNTKNNRTEMKTLKKEIFDHDGKRIELQNAELKHWHSTLLKKLLDVMPDVRTLLELEMNKLISLKYNMYTSWAVKVLMELSTADKTHSPKRETQISHDLKKTRQRFFCLYLLYHIRNASLLTH